MGKNSQIHAMVETQAKEKLRIEAKKVGISLSELVRRKSELPLKTSEIVFLVRKLNVYLKSIENAK